MAAVAALGKGTPFSLLSLWGGAAWHELAAHLPSLQGSLGVLLGHPFPCHQEAPGHLGVLEDQGAPWLHLDLDHPGRSSHRHGEMKQCWQGVLSGCPQHALHPWAPSTLASAVPEQFNCSFQLFNFQLSQLQLGEMKVSSPIYAIWVWFLNQDCA